MNPTHPARTKGPKHVPSIHWGVLSEDGHICFGYQAAAMIYESEGECRFRADFAKMRERVEPVLVIPCATSAQAKRALPFWKLSEEEQVEAIAKELWYNGNPNHSWLTFGKPFQERHRETARAILNLISP